MEMTPFQCVMEMLSTAEGRPQTNLAQDIVGLLIFYNHIDPRWTAPTWNEAHPENNQVGVNG